jgi:arylformamidase
MAHGKVYDVSVPLRDGMPVYPGDVQFRRRMVSTIAAGGDCNLSELSLGAHTGTHVDAPWHMSDRGTTIDTVPPSTLLGPAHVVEIRSPVSADLPELRQHEWGGVERVLLKTSNSGKLQSLDHFVEDYVYISGDGAEFLAGLGLLLVGVDYLSVDPLHSGTHPAHAPLVAAGVVIIEGLDLYAVPAGRYELFCGPLLIQGGDGAPARVLLREL